VTLLWCEVAAQLLLVRVVIYRQVAHEDRPRVHLRPLPRRALLPVRLLVVLFLRRASGCCIVVLCVPNLSSLIDLVGAVANTALASLPCLLHARLLLRKPSGTRAPAPSGSGGGGGCGGGGDGGGAAQAPPRFPRVEWVLLVLDALVVAFCAFVFAVGLGEALQELDL